MTKNTNIYEIICCVRNQGGGGRSEGGREEGCRYCLGKEKKFVCVCVCVLIMRPERNDDRSKRRRRRVCAASVR